MRWSIQGCSKKFYQPGNHKLQTGSWLTKFLEPRSGEEFYLAPPWGSEGMLPQRILKMKGLRLANKCISGISETI